MKQYTRAKYEPPSSAASKVNKSQKVGRIKVQ